MSYIHLKPRQLLRKMLAEIPPHTFTMSWDEYWQKFNQFLKLKRYDLLLHHTIYNYNPRWNYNI